MKMYIQQRIVYAVHTSTIHQRPKCQSADEQVEKVIQSCRVIVPSCNKDG